MVTGANVIGCDMIPVAHGRGRAAALGDGRTGEVLWFHLMPYPAFPEDFNRKHRSVWVDIDPALFDPVVVADCYERYIDQLVHAESAASTGSASTSTTPTATD